MSDGSQKGKDTSSRFRTELKGELGRWVEEGLVEQAQAERLGERYNLDEHEVRAPSSLLVPVIYLMGILLIGGGAISFVAAHWESIPAYVRVAMLAVVMLACEISGFYLWKVKGREKLGHSLVTLGTLIFGANIFLIAQIFHIRGDFHNAFGVWALGAAAMAYATASSQNMWIACITSFVWFCGWIGLNPHAFCWYPFVLIPACLPFVIRRCAGSFFLMLLAAGISVITLSGMDSSSLWSFEISCVGVCALAYGIGMIMAGKDNLAFLAPLAQLPAVFGILLIAYFLAFHDLAKELVEELWQAEGWLWTIPAGMVYLAAAALWIKALVSPTEAGGLKIQSRAVLAGILLLIIGILSGQEILLRVAANIAMIGIATSLIWSAVAYYQRRPFWYGLLIFILVIVSRFLEWETYLIIKSLVFICCGALLVWGGARFERHLKRKSALNENKQ